MNIDVDLYSPRHIPLESALSFIVKTLPKLGWDKTGEDEVVMDVGCGAGGTTKKLILPLFSSSSKIFAMDVIPDMIALAKKQNSSPQIEYSVADIGDWSSLQRWKNKITKLVSISVFQWLKDQRNAFQHVYQLLQKGGEAAFFFPIQTAFHASIIEMQNGPKWSHLFNGVENFVPESHYKGYGASHYRKMLEELKFEVLYCWSGVRIDTFPSEKAYREFFTSICILRKYVPGERLNEFENDFVGSMLRQNGRDFNGNPFHEGSFAEIVVRKSK